MNEKDQENAEKLAEVINEYAKKQSWTIDYTLELLTHLVEPMLKTDRKQEPYKGITEEEITENHKLEDI
jgi:hypothetical protein